MLYKEDTEITMQDALHHCLMCGELAHECEENIYRCDDSDCGFSWKVITCDE